MGQLGKAKGKPKQHNNRKSVSRSAAALLTLAAVALLLAVGVTARYLWETWSDYAAVTSEPFYFTVDLLGDSKMAPAADQGHFTLQNPESRTWQLYGGGAHRVEFRLQNYYDALRVTQEPITYSVSLVNGDGINATLRDGEGNSLADTLTLDSSSADAVNGRAEQTLCLTVPPCKEKATLSVRIESTRPYKKTIELHFEVYPAQGELTYEIVDKLSSPYAELILRNGTSEELRPRLDWSDTSLSIDNTNALTLGEGFVPQTGMEEKTMELSRALKPGESVSIFFFKSEGKDYATDVTTVKAPYLILVENPA